MPTAARLIEHGQPLRVEDYDPPAPGPGEVTVRVVCAALNPIDRYVIAGRVAPDGPLPRIAGMEAAGHLVDGRAVIVHGDGVATTRDGVWATEAVVPASSVVDVPDGLDLEQAASMGIAGLTAWNVVGLAEVTPDDRVLVLGAAGGVGLPIVSLAASAGATVWGQTGSDGKAAAILEAGAAEAVVTDAAGLAEATRSLSPTVVVDPLGHGFTEAALSVLAPRGRQVVYGTSAGPDVAFNLQAVYRASQRIVGYGGTSLTTDERRAGLAAAMAAARDGRFRIPVGRTYPLAAVNEALEALADREATGKILIQLI
jgi:NADPH2:quinone reductase